MLGRLLERGKTSGREDDNRESIKKRFSRRISFCLAKELILDLDTYKLDTMPVIEHYKALGKVAEVGFTCLEVWLSLMVISRLIALLRLRKFMCTRVHLCTLRFSDITMPFSPFQFLFFIHAFRQQTPGLHL